MSRIASTAAWRVAAGTAAWVLLVAGCSGTVEASYRPPAPPAPSATPAPVLAHPDPDADQLARAQLRARPGGGDRRRAAVRGR